MMTLGGPDTGPPEYVTYLNDEESPRADVHHFLSANGALYATWEDHREVCILNNNRWEVAAGGHIGDEILRLKGDVERLRNALEATLKVIKAVNEAHLPGTRVPGFEGALEAVLQGDAVLKKAGLRLGIDRDSN